MSDDPCAAERKAVRRLRDQYETRMAKLNVDQVINAHRDEQESSDLEAIGELRAQLTEAQERLRECEQAEDQEFAA